MYWAWVLCRFNVAEEGAETNTTADAQDDHVNAIMRGLNRCKALSWYIAVIDMTRG